MYSVSPAIQTLWLPPSSGSNHATSWGSVRSAMSITWSRPYARPSPMTPGAAALLTRREHLVADEDVPAVPPARVRAADEARAPGELDLLVELVQVVLVLQHELRILRRSTLHAVADVQDDEAVVPVGQGRESVPDVDVMQHPSRFGALYLPAGHLLRVVGVADVDDPHGAGRVVGQVDVALVDVGAVDATRDRLGELGDGLRMRRIFEGENHDAVLAGGCALARHDAVLAVLGGHHVVMTREGAS